MYLKEYKSASGSALRFEVPAEGYPANHIPVTAHALSPASTETEKIEIDCAAWAANPNAVPKIVLMLHTALSVYFVEIKRQAEIGREVIDEVAEKVKRIRVARGKTIKTALVYSGHLAPIVEAQGYFNAVIDIRDILF